MKLTAKNNYVIVKLQESIEETQHVSGIYLAPERTAPCLGEILSVGPSCQTPELKEGLKVLIPPSNVGESYHFEDGEYLFILDHEVYGLVKS